MGRLPSSFGNRVIKSRTPYVMENRVVVTTGQQAVSFPSSAFLHDEAAPFEVHRMIPRVFEVDDNGDLVLDSLVTQANGLLVVRASIYATKHEQDMTKVPTPLGLLVKGAGERTWEWAEPNYLLKPEGYVITVDVDDLSLIFTTVPILRVEISFEGFLLELGEAVGGGA